MIGTWLEASRWVYNLAVEVLQHGIPRVWRHIASMVMAEVRLARIWHNRIIDHNLRITQDRYNLC